MDKLKEVIEYAVKVEELVGELYEFFAEIFKEDFEFWYKIATEEEQHASIIKGAEELLIKQSNYYTEALSSIHEKLKNDVEQLRKIVDDNKANPPDRKGAFELAKKLENSAAELHFQKFITKSPDSKLEEVFQTLAQADKDHAERIEQYIKEHLK